MSQSISMKLPDALFKYLDECAKAEKKNLDEYITGQLFSVSFDFLLEEAKKRAEIRPTGVKFCVRDLFTDDWDYIPKGQKLALGRNFYNEVEEKKTVPRVKSVGKDAANTMWYIRN